MDDAVRSVQGQADSEVTRLKRALVALKRKLDQERVSRQQAEELAESERRAAATARLAAEPRIAAWKAAMVEADPDTVMEIEDD